MKRISVFFIAVLMITSFSLAPQTASAAEKLNNIKITLANPLFNPGISFLWISNFLGYYQEEGVDAQFVAAQGGAQGMGWALAGRTHIAIPRPIPILFKAAKAQKAPPLMGVYIVNRDAIYADGVAVPIGSPIKSVCDLQGKKVGVMSQRDAGPLFVKKALETCGIPKKNQRVTYLPVGPVAKAATAMKLGRVEAWANVDVQYTLAKASGFKFNIIPYQKGWTKNLFGNVVWVNKEYLAKNRKTVIGFLRGLAKGSLFFYTNPKATLEAHWVLYPESMPKGISKAKATARMLNVLVDRAPKLRPDDGTEKINKFGAHHAGEWDEYLKFVGLDKIISKKLLKELYTNDMIDEVNNFDRQKVIDRAKNWDFAKEVKNFRALEKRYGK
ncbi:MAG: ABC transporter substrate-binding protein [Nitrospinaceae bacterium]|jgi:NitT/TauT family transport system substrate-binding protein|nr:ABC transporter substrate-binding protein [Nitrospinaceae bacterium]MBT3434329.1 ABC transporter substrate-binding protein [Nitrospinaceae bacterium]MBT3820083.1 ABC transporter substrate-binding protein [Nitrospinaceae bacterium]MBT4094974.1 ABC transporter substrate-binding protein [Nitrospinaceae bacterium]MBT4432245.1 ABC transporter substrate-binding protein [Nitrospinaceae bacterium]